MAEAIQSIDELDDLVSSYDKYFTSLGTEDAELVPPATEVEGLKYQLALSISDNATTEEFIELFDRAKIGFTLTKFARTGTPAWCRGVKFTGHSYYSDDDEEEEEDSSEGNEDEETEEHEEWESNE